MAVKNQNKSQQLATQIWAIANELRNNMDASRFKDYVLGILFYKYLSERTEAYMTDLLKADGISYEEALSDPELGPEVRKWSIEGLGYIIEPKYLWSSFMKEIKAGVVNPRNPMTGDDKKFTVEHLSKAITRLVESTIGQPSEAAFQNLFDAMDLESVDIGREVSERSKLIAAVMGKINTVSIGINDTDILGTAYMILIGLFQSSAGKKGGEFFTPTPASSLLSQLACIGIKHVTNCADICGGSGSLLLEVQKHLPEGKVGHLYSQENSTTFNLLRMNLIMHGIDYHDFTVYNDDSLIHDNFYNDEGDPIPMTVQVANPPYSARNTAFSDAFLDDPRFRAAGVLAPKTKADLAFVETMVYHMADDGRLAVLLPHGILFRGGSEYTIRKYFIETLNCIDAIVGLPGTMFHGTSIPTLALVCRKNRNGDSGNIYLVDASKYYAKEGNYNVLRASDIKRIVDAVTERKDIDRFARKVSLEEIRENDYNLNIPRYVDSSEPAENWDLRSLMLGGIPDTEIDALEKYWKQLPTLRSELFASQGNGYSDLHENAAAIIDNNADVSAMRDVNVQTFGEDFKDYLSERLIDRRDTVDEKDTETEIADEIFTRIDAVPIVDRYSAYQALDDEWKEITADLEILRSDGMTALKEVVPNMVLKKRSGKEEAEEVQEGFKGKLLPFELIQEEFLSSELNRIKEMQNEISEAEARISELAESLSEDDKGYTSSEDLEIFDSDKNAFILSGVESALRDAYTDVESEEICSVREYIKLLEGGAKKPEKEEYIKSHKEVCWNSIEAAKDGTYAKKPVQQYLDKLCASFTFPEDSLEAVLSEVTVLSEKKKFLEKALKLAAKELEEATIKAYGEMRDEDAVRLLKKKWADPVSSGILNLFDAEIGELRRAVKLLGEKYGTTIKSIESEIEQSEKELSEMVESLVGSDADMEGLNELIKLLGGI